MNTTVDDVMVSLVIVAREGTTVGEARELMDGEGIHALPVVDEAGEAIGIVTSSDVLGDVAAEMPLDEVMSTKVYTVPRYEGTHIAARVMRNHHLHHFKDHDNYFGVSTPMWDYVFGTFPKP